MIKRTLFNSLYLLLHAVVSKAFVLLVNVYLARSSSPLQYGLFVLIRSVINFIETIFSASVMPVVVKKSSSEGLSKAVFLRLMVLTLIIFTGLILQTAAVFMFSFTDFLKSDLEIYISIAGYLILLMLANGFLTAVLMGNEKYKFLVFGSLASGLFCTLIALILIDEYGVIGALYSLISFQIVEILIKGYIVFNAFVSFKKIFAPFKTYLAKELFGATQRLMPLIFASLINSLVFLFARLNLSYVEDGLIQLAFFDVAFQFFIIGMLVLNSVTNIFLSKMSKATNNKLLMGLLFQNIIFVISIAFLGASILYFGAEVLITIFGESYSSNELKLMSFCVVPYGFAIVFNRFFIVIDERTKLTVVSFVSGIAMIAFLLLAERNATNLIYGFTIYYLISTLVYFYFLWKRHYDNKTFEKPS